MKSKPILTALIFFSVTLLLCFALLSFLQKGIHIPRISLGNVTINEFYLILDKKLNIQIDNIILDSTQDKKSAAFDQKSLEDHIRLTLRIIKNSKILLDILGEVDVKKIIVGDFIGELALKDRTIKAHIPHWRIEVNLYDDADLDHLQIHIAELAHLPSGAFLTGVINYDLNSAEMEFQSVLTWGDDFVFDANFRSDFKTFDLEGSSYAFSSFAFLQNIAKDWPDEAKDWLFNCIQGDFLISKMSLHSDFAINKILQAVKENLFIDFRIRNGSVIYQDSLSPVVFKEANAIYHKGTVRLALQQPSYEKIPLTGSYLEFNNIFVGDYPTLKIEIFANTKLDQKIHKILKSYDIHLPLNQKSSTVDIHVSLAIPFGKPGLDIFGNFKVKNAVFDLKGLGLQIKEAEIFLKNNRVAFSEAAIHLEDVIDVDSKLSLIIDTDKKTLEGIADVDYLSLKDHEDILNLSELNIPFTGDFSGENFTLQLPSLQTHLILGERIRIIADNFKALYPYSSLLQEYGVSEGTLHLQTHDSGAITLQALIQKHQLPIKKLDNSPLMPINVYGKIKDGEFELDTQNDLIKISSKKNLIDISVKDLLFSLKTGTSESSSQGSNSSSKTIRVKGKSILLEMGANQLFADQVTLSVDKQKIIKGVLKNKNTSFQVSYSDGLLSVYGDRITSELINNFLKQNAFDGGIFTLLGEYQGGVFKGNVLLKKVTIKELSGVQNVIAFVDTIPSLLVFKSPGFDEYGYKVEDGSIDFEVTSDYLRIEKFQLTGNSIDSEGAGIVNLNQKNLDFNVKISAFKSWSTVINSAPLVGYVITGDNGSFSTFINIRGTLKNPKINVDLTNKIIQAPAILIERTFKTPIKIFEQIFKK